VNTCRNEGDIQMENRENFRTKFWNVEVVARLISSDPKVPFYHAKREIE
jgi:hypothetical protein